MKTNDFENLERIVTEEAYFFPPEGKYRLDWKAEIFKDGSVVDNDFEEGKETCYKSNPEDVSKLFNDIKSFIDTIKGVDVTMDDTDRKITLEYKNGYQEVLPSFAYDKNHNNAIDLINDYFEKSCKECKPEELD